MPTKTKGLPHSAFLRRQPFPITVGKLSLSSIAKTEKVKKDLQRKKDDAEFVEHANTEPLREECNHFLDCIQSRKQPLTNVQSGIDVLKVLHACQQSIEQNGVPVSL